MDIILNAAQTQEFACEDELNKEPNKLSSSPCERLGTAGWGSF